MLVSKQPGLSRLPWLLSGLVICLLVGCGTKTPPQSITGRIVQNGKPVYPVVLLLQGSGGKSFTANVKNQNGEFSIFGIEPGQKYSVAVEPIQLGGISQADRAAAAKAAEQAKAEGRELRREETLPPHFENANIDFPAKYKSFDTSGLFVDCSEKVPTEPIVFDLK